jgi:uncharacterized protein (DUF924 family)
LAAARAKEALSIAQEPAMQTVSPDEILAFWFAPEAASRWYASDAGFDAEIRRRFLATYEAARAGRLTTWRATPKALLALIIVLDQFPRNMFRREPRAFAADAEAVGLTREGLARGFDASLNDAELDFFYMPLMHSERLEDHELLAAQGRGEERYARHHREIIARFGRFPHRNATLGRESTSEEAAYLAQSDPLRPG